MSVMGALRWFISISICLLGAYVYRINGLRNLYLSTGLAPRGSGGPWKETAASLLLSIPRLTRLVQTGSSRVNSEAMAASLEGYHTETTMTPGRPKLSSSPHFAENFYFWIHAKPSRPGEVPPMLITTRLSFNGLNGARVTPWFSVSFPNGEDWDLPSEFEEKSLQHASSDPRRGEAPGLGVLLFEVLAPMKKWRLTYKGLLQSAKDPTIRKHVEAEITLSFTPKDNFFYNADWDEFAVALSMSAKKWDQAFWHNLRSQNQERYASASHGGEISFRFAEEDASAALVYTDVLGSRDHNFGIRNWRFIDRYIWWPPVHFDVPLVIEGVTYKYFAGSFVEYGNTFEDSIFGGLISDAGDIATFSGATSMRVIAPTWFAAKSQRHVGIGAKLLPGSFDKFTIGFMGAKYALDIVIKKRGKKAGLWEHSFYVGDGDFEIHEALTMFEFQVRREGDPEHKVIAQTSATGLFEFGGNLVGLDDAE